jgi:hypothetical protein
MDGLTCVSGRCSRWVSAGGSYCAGIAATPRFAYCAASGSGVIQLDINTVEVVREYGIQGYGVAIDTDGHVWPVGQRDSVGRIKVEGDTHTIEDNLVTGMGSPYTYSDMTGAQLRYATDPLGYYSKIYEACAADETPMWRQLLWEANLPLHTRITWSVRTAATIAELNALEWTVAGIATHDRPITSVAIDALLDSLGGPKRFLEVKVELASSRQTDATLIEYVTPQVKSVTVQVECADTVAI